MKGNRLVYAYLLLIVTMVHDLFHLSALSWVGHAFKPMDLGLILIGGGLAYYVLGLRQIKPLANFFTWWVIFYLLFIMVQVTIAAFKYSQPIVDGILQARHQFYYLSFPLFILALDDLQKVGIFMKALSALVVVIAISSIINYFGPTLYDHERAEGWGVRGGVVRAYVPAMSLLVMAAVWQFWAYLKDHRLFKGSLITFLLLYGTVVFRQTRGRLIALTMTLLLMLVFKRRYGLLVAGVGVSLLGVALQGFLGDQSIVLNLAESAYTDISQTEGTWAGRMRQIQESWHVFTDNILTGSGGLVLRSETGHMDGWGDLFHVAFRTDLGYWTWLKFFGFPGILLLMVLLFAFYWYVLRCGTLGERGYFGQFAAYHFTCVLISMVTIPYMTNAADIVVLCLTWAVLVTAASESRDTEMAELPEHEGGSEDAGLQRSPSEKAASPHSVRSGVG